MATEECLVCHKCALTHIHMENLFSLNSSTLLNPVHYLYSSSQYSDLVHLHLSLDVSSVPPPSLPGSLSHFPYLKAHFVCLSFQISLSLLLQLFISLSFLRELCFVLYGQRLNIYSTDKSCKTPRGQHV